MAYRNLQSRPRDYAFTGVCVFTVLTSLAECVVINGLILQAEWPKKYLPAFLGRMVGNFDAIAYAATVMGAILAVLFCAGYILSLDAYRRRRPAIRLYLLIASVCAFPAAVILSHTSNDLLIWGGAVGGALLAPFFVLTGERVIGAAFIASGRYARRHEWWEFSAMMLRQGLRFFTSSRLARRDYGMVLRSLGEVTAARALLEPLFEEGYRDEEMLDALCELALTDEDWPQAAERLEALYAKRPGDKETITQLALAWVRCEQFDSALELLKQVPEGKWTGQMLKLLRECACAQGDLEGALMACERLAGGKVYEKARAEYEPLVAAFPGDARVFYSLASLAAERRQASEEAEWLERAVQAVPHDWGAHRRLAALYREISRPDREIVHLEALATQPEHPEAVSLIEYSAALGNRAQHQEAARLLEASRRRFPGDGRFPLSLARHYLSLDDTEQAFNEATRAVELCEEAARQPTLPKAAQAAVGEAAPGDAADDASLLAAARAMLRRVEKAIAHKNLAVVRNIAKESPDDLQARFAYIALLAENDEVDACVRELDSLVSHRPETKALAQKEALRFTQKTDHPFLIYSYLSDLALQDRDFDRALELYKVMSQRSLDPQEIIGEGCRRILTLQHDHLPAQRVLAEFNAARGDWHEVAAILASYFEHGGEHIESVDRMMFQAALQTENSEFALRWLEPVMAYNAHDPQPLIAVAGLLESKDRNEEAVALMRRARDLDTRNLAIYERIQAVDAKIKEKRYFELRDLLDRDPNNTALNMEMGDVHFGRGEHLRAIRHYQLAAKDPSLANLCAGKQAVCLAQRRVWDMAEEQIAQIRIEAASDVELREIKGLLYAVGAIYESEQLRPQAFEAYKRVFRIDAGFRDVAMKLEKLSGR